MQSIRPDRRAVRYGPSIRISILIVTTPAVLYWLSLPVVEDLASAKQRASDAVPVLYAHFLLTPVVFQVVLYATFSNSSRAVRTAVRWVSLGLLLLLTRWVASGEEELLDAWFLTALSMLVAAIVDATMDDGRLAREAMVRHYFGVRDTDVTSAVSAITEVLDASRPAGVGTPVDLISEHGDHVFWAHGSTLTVLVRASSGFLGLRFEGRMSAEDEHRLVRVLTRTSRGVLVSCCGGTHPGLGPAGHGALG